MSISVEIVNQGSANMIPWQVAFGPVRGVQGSPTKVTVSQGIEESMNDEVPIIHIVDLSHKLLSINLKICIS